jgi:GntR family transcriptional regulator, transcriptional repressor for pyruvate dehydrogenase complex
LAVTTRTSRPAIEAAAVKLRAIVRQSEDGALIGSEDMLLEKLGFSRSTVRQVARLLEREGILRVRRGLNGGYFSSRPDRASVARTVSAYLETLEMNAQDVTVIASVLWVEVLRKAAALGTKAARALAETYRERVLAIKPSASFAQVLAVEQESRAAIFDLVKARYIELIFEINAAFAGKRSPPTFNIDGSAVHRKFVRAWRDAKLMELSAIAERDVELGMMAARHIRAIWHKRIWTLAGHSGDGHGARLQE